MTPNVARLGRLLREGYEVADITSDHESIAARLRRPGGAETVLVLTRSDAECILYDAPEPLAAPARRVSRYLVTTPLR